MPSTAAASTSAEKASRAETSARPDVRSELEALLAKRIVVMDGAMGSMLQRHGFQEADFRGELLRDHPKPLQGINDVLVLTRPQAVAGVHRSYLEAGADIVETNTFNANAISLHRYGLESRARELNRAAAALAKSVTTAWEREHPGDRRFVAGSIGPTDKTASISPDVKDPAFRAVTWDDLVRAYEEQVHGLIDGGVDILLPETVIDTLNLKAALFAISKVQEERGTRLPVMASLTITDASARILSGQTLEAAWHSIAHHDLTAVLINCALGPKQMRPHVEALARVAGIPVGCYPNAGLPNELGEYDEGPDDVAGSLVAMAKDGFLNLAGGRRRRRC
jgi:5-methyltetrahydrofolate--homocysteine methyltransferase